MISVIIDLLLTNILYININTFLYILKKLSISNFIYSLFLVYIITNSVNSVMIFVFFYISYQFIFKYLDKNIYTSLIIYCIFYICLYRINLSLIINLLIVIYLHKIEYD